MKKMGLKQLLKKKFFLIKDGLDQLNTDLGIRGITADSRRCASGYFFIATKGSSATSYDGHDFIDEAIQKGAALIGVEENFLATKKYHVPVIRFFDSKLALCHLTESFHENPSTAIKVIGITGTNGKTSTSFMLHSILRAAGFKPKIMGTLGFGDPGSLTWQNLTTMDPEFISAQMAKWREEGVSHVIMEISSHALSLKRIEAINFSAVALTNITQDHLDFHLTMENYQQAKSRLFFDLAPDSIKILPLHHPFGDGKLKYVNYFGEQASADFSYGNIKLTDVGLTFSLKHNDVEQELALPLWGDFQVANATLAAAIATRLDVSYSAIEQGLEKCPLIPGRLECVAKALRKVFVDYAHTPDALASLLRTVRKITSQKIVLVFGCAGDRDKYKRPLMAKIAEDLADILIITDDNPRSENPEMIRQEIMQGLSRHKQAYNIGDRREAIRHALACSGNDDVVVIAGKGHENYQIYGTMTHVFSDHDEVKKVLGAT